LKKRFPEYKLNLNQEFGRNFFNIGLQCQPDIHGYSMRGTDHSDLVFNASQEEINYDEQFSLLIHANNLGEYATRASLENLRRIRASISLPPGSGTPQLSGLRLEYFNHQSSEIVGQWKHNYEDTFDLSQDEQISSITIWSRRIQKAPQSHRIWQGIVKAIRIETTKQRSKTFGDGDTLLYSSMRHEYTAGTNETIVSETWRSSGVTTHAYL
jgi:hypothetical protein